MQTTFLKSFTDPKTFDNVRVFGSIDKPLFMAKDVAEILKYKNTRKAIRDHVDEEDKVLLNDSGTGNELINTGNESVRMCRIDSMLINESGLYSLILRSRKPEAKQFKRWITAEVLPSLRKEGKYIIEKNEAKLDEEIKTLKINNFTAITNIMVRFGVDDRDLILIKNHSKMLLSSEATVVVDRLEVECSISKRLVEKFNYKKNNHKLLMKIGNALAQQYFNIYDTKPPKRDQYVDGTLRSINHYTIGYFEQHGDDVIESHLKNEHVR